MVSFRSVGAYRIDDIVYVLGAASCENGNGLIDSLRQLVQPSASVATVRNGLCARFVDPGATQVTESSFLSFQDHAKEIVRLLGADPELYRIVCIDLVSEAGDTVGNGSRTLYIARDQSAHFLPLLPVKKKDVETPRPTDTTVSFRPVSLYRIDDAIYVLGAASCENGNGLIDSLRQLVQSSSANVATVRDGLVIRFADPGPTQVTESSFLSFQDHTTEIIRLLGADPDLYRVVCIDLASEAGDAIGDGPQTVYIARNPSAHFLPLLPMELLETQF
jgi:hypothetical protein